MIPIFLRGRLLDEAIAATISECRGAIGADHRAHFAANAHNGRHDASAAYPVLTLANQKGQKYRKPLI
jgi:hypothetical protein